MKRSIFLTVLLVSATIGSAFAQTATSACINIPYGLSRGMENSHVLALQKFLFAKGLLNAFPNGYFGPATFAGVKAYQKNAGFMQVGSVGPATRALIKKETCAQPAQAQAQPPVAQGNQATTTQQAQTAAPFQASNLPMPALDSIDIVTVFSGGMTTWGFNLYGRNFGTTSPATVYYKNMGTGRIYAIGQFWSLDGSTITLPHSLGATKFACGEGCSEVMPANSYEVSVKTDGGHSYGKYMEIRPFTISSMTATDKVAIQAQASSSKIGTVTFSASIPVIVHSVALAISTSTISDNGMGAAAYNDAARRDVLASGTELPAFQSMIVEAVVSTSNMTHGTVHGYFTVEVEDYIGKRRTTFKSPEFLASVDGLI